ncbi:MAG: response regulator [Desulfurivibrionaceae bacterium]
MATRHILLAEGRPNLQHSLSLMLKQAEYRVSLAKSTGEALTLAKALTNTTEGIDLLIVDLDSASLEACRAFMHALSASTLSIPYLVLAEEIRDQAADVLTKHGCLTCITKPFEPETLLRSVHNALDRLESQDGYQSGRKSEKTSAERTANQPG